MLVWGREACVFGVLFRSLRLWVGSSYPRSASRQLLIWEAVFACPQDAQSFSTCFRSIPRTQGIGVSSTLPTPSYMTGRPRPLMFEFPSTVLLNCRIFRNRGQGPSYKPYYLEGLLQPGLLWRHGCVSQGCQQQHACDVSKSLNSVKRVL